MAIISRQLVSIELLLDVGLDVEFVVELLICIRLFTAVVVDSVVTGLPTITGETLVVATVDSLDIVGSKGVGVGIAT